MGGGADGAVGGGAHFCSAWLSWYSSTIEWMTERSLSGCGAGSQADTERSRSKRTASFVLASTPSADIARASDACFYSRLTRLNYVAPGDGTAAMERPRFPRRKRPSKR